MSEAAPTMAPVADRAGRMPETTAEVSERILRQALEAALFEGLVDYVLMPAENALWGTLYFSLGDVDFQCDGRLRGFGRLRVNVASLVRVHSTRPPVSVEEVIDNLLSALPGDSHTHHCFREELEKTRYWCEWNQKRLTFSNNRRALAFADLDAAIHEGHPYHPCFKARFGFTEEDHARYSPECGEAIRPHWVAVPRSLVVVSGTAREPDRFWRRELGNQGYETLKACARIRDLDPDATMFVPVHPWQWRHLLATVRQREPNTIVDLGQPGDDYLASQSVRTLLNRRHPSRADLKLPLSIVNTSAPRHLLSHGIESGPRLSQWIADTVAGDPFFQRYPLVVLREYAGVRVRENEWLPDSDPEVCRFGALWRESVEARMRPNENATPMMALALTEQDGKPFIDPWVKHYGLEPWLRQLLDTLVLPVWHLVARHGIGLEAHAQNTILLHDSGWPVRLAARDFHESVEYVEDFLADPEAAPAFSREARYAHARPNEYYWMESVEALRELVMDTLFVFHLSELALLCEEYYGLSEERFWSLAAECLAHYRCRGYCEPRRLEALDYRAPMIRVESLLRKKLCPTASEYHHRVFNPFSNPDPE